MDIEALLDEIETLLADARPLPLTAAVIVSRPDLEDLVADLRTALPEEVREARWVLRERDEVLAAARREADQLREDGRAEADRLAGETEVARLARREGDRLVAEAREQARSLKLEAEDYVDARLAGFEQLLRRTLDAVVKGRERFRVGSAGVSLADEAETAPQTHAAAQTQLYDQERADRR